MLVRDNAGVLEIYAMRRQPTMAFAAGMYVFPGGGVQESDYVASIPWVGPSRADWAKILGCGEPLARCSRRCRHP
ncbi:hypothetical protein [Aeromicrobium sp. UC242_57]|uniref:hypothetical protein n=1 Tax=Aeromicrobium sp. UC242_57 TaxID=3374624 RepID=UPI00379C1542